MTTTAPPTTGLAKHLAFLAQHADLLAQHGHHITSLDVGNRSIGILVHNEGTALDLAVALHVSGEPVRRQDPTEWDGYTREATINGIDVRIASCWHTTKAAA